MFGAEADMPTDEEIRAYAAQLPTIYRDILGSFPAVNPRRRVGDGLTADTLHAVVEEAFPEHRPGDIDDALERLVARGFLTQRQGLFFAPTPLGERLITAVTGKKPAPE